MGIGLAEPDAGIADEEFGGEVIRRFDHEIVGGDDLGGIGLGDPAGVGSQAKIRPEPGGAPRGGGRFFPAHIVPPVQDLALQVGELDPVAVRDPDLADPAGGQVEEGGTSQTAQADDQDAALAAV